MAWQWNVYILPLVLGGFVVVGSTIYLLLKWREEHSPPGLGLAVWIMLCFAITIVFQIISDLSTAPEIKILANQLLYLGIAPMSAFLVAYVLVYTGYGDLLGPITYGLLFLPSALTILAVFTYDVHWLFWSELILTESAGTVVLINEHGPAYLGYIVYSYAYLLLSLVLLIIAATGASTTYKRQAGALCAGISLVAGAGALYVLIGVPPHYPTPPIAAFVPAAVILSWAVLRKDLFTSVPVAYRTVIESIDEGVLVSNGEGTVVRANDAAIDILGESHGTVTGVDRSTLLGRLENTEPAEEGDVTGTIDDRRIEVSTEEVTQSGTPVGEITLLNDVTEQERREQKLRHQNERLDEFASVVSHDIQGPLMRIRASTNMLRETGDMSHADTIAEAADRIDWLTGDLLRLAREGQQLDDLEELSVAATAEAAWDLFPTPDATLTINSEGVVCADPGRLQQLFENLFKNCLDHAGSDVSVTVSVTEDGFYVEDDGPGIPSELREAVRKRGYTGSEGGSGFGLDIVSQIATAHHWTLSITDGTDGGARIEFTGVDVSRIDPQPAPLESDRT